MHLWKYNNQNLHIYMNILHFLFHLSVSGDLGSCQNLANVKSTGINIGGKVDKRLYGTLIPLGI
jgi:hypothetical protein